MTRPGTPTPPDHIEAARVLLVPRAYEGDDLSYDTSVVVATLRALTHAVLALVGEVEAIREAATATSSRPRARGGPT